MINIKNKIKFYKKEMFYSDAVFGAVFLLAINFVSIILNNNFNRQTVL